MANKLNAITTYMPRIVRGIPAQVEEVANLIAGRTSMNPGSVLQALKEFLYVLNFFISVGRSVHLPGVGTFSPSVKLNGKIKVNVRIDKDLISELNKSKSSFKAKIDNLENIGLTVEDLVQLWNDEHPDDLVA